VRREKVTEVWNLGCKTTPPSSLSVNLAPEEDTQFSPQYLRVPQTLALRRFWLLYAGSPLLKRPLLYTSSVYPLPVRSW